MSAGNKHRLKKDSIRFRNPNGKPVSYLQKLNSDPPKTNAADSGKR